MKRPQYADIPKFKKIERQMRMTVSGVQDTIMALAAADGSAHELKCLDAAAKECVWAEQHLRKAIHDLYSAFDKPSSIDALRVPKSSSMVTKPPVT